MFKFIGRRPFTIKRPFGAQAFVRNDNFKVLSDADLSHFESLLPKKRIITEPDMLEESNADWTRKYVGQSRLMLKPKTNEEVSAILQYCNEKMLAVVP